MDYLQAAVLGLVQGLTEFIPVSSTAHLRIVPSLLGWQDPGTAFSAVIQLGTLVAVLVFFWKDLWKLGSAAVGALFSAKVRQSPEARLAWAIALGNVPVAVLGLSFKDFIETEARSLFVIAAMLGLVALGLWFAERRSQRAPAQLEMKALGWKRVLAVGGFQALALLPGASRSGSTIMGGLLLGMHRAEAARFSFLLGVPAILGSGLFELKSLMETPLLSEGGWGVLMAGLVAAAISGYLSIGFLLRYLSQHSTTVFVVYRLLLGAVVAGLAGWGLIA